MKVNSINQQTNKQNFKGKDNVFQKTVEFIADKPKTIAMLAGSSVVAQKIVMSGSEAIVGPIMDVGIGQAITKVTNEKDGRTNDSSKAQAIRTFAQATGGTIVGVAVRLACIGAATAAITTACAKGGGKIAEEVAKKINPENLNPEKLVDKYGFDKKMTDWGKSIGGALAIVVMLVTNFLIDAPFINWINGKVTQMIDKKANNQEQTKEAK